MNKILLGPTLETERLVLRPPALEDLDGLAAFVTDAKAMEHLGGAKSRAEAWRMLMVMAGAWALHGFFMFSIIEKKNGKWIGRIGPLYPEGWPGTEVGWGLLPEAWGKGYAVEAASAAIDWVFDELGWSEVIHCIDAPNENSARVAQKLGSRKLRKAKLPPPYDNKEVDIWGQTREEWRARKAA